MSESERFSGVGGERTYVNRVVPRNVAAIRKPILKKHNTADRESTEMRRLLVPLIESQFVTGGIDPKLYTSKEAADADGVIVGILSVSVLGDTLIPKHIDKEQSTTFPTRSCRRTIISILDEKVPAQPKSQRGHSEVLTTALDILRPSTHDRNSILTRFRELCDAKEFHHHSKGTKKRDDQSR